MIASSGQASDVELMAAAAVIMMANLGRGGRVVLDSVMFHLNR